MIVGHHRRPVVSITPTICQKFVFYLIYTRAKHSLNVSNVIGCPWLRKSSID
jgi:hypothetical protein